MPTSEIPHALTPYDTGARLEPHIWPLGDSVASYGLVDFDDDEGATVFAAYGARLDDGTHAMFIGRIAGEENSAVYVDGVLYTPANERHTDTKQEAR